MESAFFVDTGLLSPDPAGLSIMSIFGSGVIATAASSHNPAAGSTAAATTAKPAAAAPPFPTFLLRSLPLPLRRTRTRDRSSCSHDDHDDDEEHGRDCGGALPPPLSSSVDSAASSVPSSPTAGNDKAGPAAAARQRPPPQPDRAAPATLRCGICATDLAFASQIVSKGFTGRHGRAFLVAPPSALNATAAPTGDLINIKTGRPENRQLVTGSHVVADISCRVCGTKVGWKYVDAREPPQRYKVGKFILETARVVVWRAWGEEDDDDDGGSDEEASSWSPRRESGRRAENGSGAEDSGDSDDGDGPVVFDSDDEDECEDIFAGTWNAATAANRRKVRRALAGRKA